jgi:heme/copper-type cytochrome/quinol oxidase subunit 3
MMPSPNRSSSLRQVRAAQLRARAIRGAIGKVVLGSIFLVGALANARAPDHLQRTSLLLMTGLLVLSTAYVALGLRVLARVRRRRARLWIAATAAWGVLSTLVVGFLLRG